MRFFHPSFLAVAVIAALTVSPAVAASTAPPPPNDNFANAMVLTGQTVTSNPVTIDGATHEPLEPSNTDNNTVWYVWSPSQDGTATFTDAGTTYYSHLAVFNGDALTDIVLITGADGNPASVTFPVKAGLVYYVSIGATDSGADGTAVLNIINKAPTITTANIVAVPAGTNDSFANAVPLNTAPLTAFTYSLEATRETLEPDFTDYQTVWWLWTAPADAEVTMEAVGASGTDVTLCVFNGDSLTNLDVVAYAKAHEANPTLNFPAKAGTSYRVSIGSNTIYNDGGPSYLVTSILNVTTAPLTISSPVIVESPAAANDNFSNAQDLGSYPDVSAFGYDGDATRENLERDGTGYQTLWWTWTAPADAEVTVSPAGSNITPVMSVFNGDSLSKLTLVGATYKSYDGFSFPAKAGFVYHISIGDYYNNNAALSPVLNITTAPLATTAPVVIGSLAAANDNFANAQDLGKNPVVTGFGYNDDATVEQNESSSFGYKTLWWTWTVPADGILSVDTFGTDIDHVLTAALGDSLTNLGTSVGVGTAATPATGRFNVSGGTVYHFAVGSRNSNQGGRLFLNLNFTPGIPHVSLKANASTVHASKTSSAAFTVTRDGDLSKKLVVNVKAKYLFGSGSRTIKSTKKLKPGKSSATLNVSFSGYPYYYGNGTIKVTVTPATGYLPAAPYKAKTFVEDN